MFAFEPANKLIDRLIKKYSKTCIYITRTNDSSLERITTRRAFDITVLYNTIQNEKSIYYDTYLPHEQLLARY